MFHYKATSSLEKIFLDTDPAKCDEVTRLTALRGERVSFQLLLTEDEKIECYRIFLEKSGALAPVTTLREVTMVPVVFPVFPDKIDDNYLSDKPGLYPDPLRDLRYTNRVSVIKGQTRAVWVTIDVPEDAPAGENTLTIEFRLDTTLWNSPVYTSEHAASLTLTVDVIPARLPEQTLILTQWFHCDGLATYYHVPVFSDRHFEIIENFARAAVKNGINMLLTPVFTPPLDTRVGGERLTTQLVGVTRNKGEYTFDFSLLDRWIDMCDRVGIRYFEISHFYTQWGAFHAPKVMATVDGEYRRLFGWDTDAVGEEYRTFLRTFIPAFLTHMKARGDDKRCHFHVSDEPWPEHVESYRAAKEQIADLLEGYPVMDALSDYSYWEKGLIGTPVPACDHIQPFLDGKVPGLWTYYCCGQCIGVSNRLISMPSYRNRSIGMQLYKYNIKGFLQWGYNFYNDCSSVDPVNPYTDVSGEYWVPGGDTCSVYPAMNGTAIDSLRIEVFYEALEDMRAMQLCETLYGHDAVVAAIEEAYGKEVVFSDCAHSAEEILRVREKINRMIADKL